MIMDMDVDMDAPHISTLREEKTPPPSKEQGFRAQGKAAAAPQGDPDKAGEDEEDQLIDDDDKSSTMPPPTSATPTATTSGRSPDSTPKKKPGPKRKTKKEKAAEAAAAENASTSSQPIPSEDGSASAEPVILKLSTAGKKKAQTTPRKTAVFTPLTSVPLPDDAAHALENVAIPQYPLPTKPFPVQAPIKIPTGFAPPMALDKSTKKIRGIAGGRWFVKTWVGDKESEYSSAIGEEKVTAMPGGMMGKFSGLSASAPVGRGGGAGKGKGSKLASAAPSAVPSPARPMTKMRILQLAPASENGDSDMAPPES
ncbi:hypothetical protein FA13DRAFT_1751274 [Coprinellus micaceus]|uniref:Uncharacterized protein n=1 Tax=Coprinellus micaceus TaxID=71717 RepID=A0A4Y7TWK3_COPMI|nr:hypothetical protein FA13DRAFT_1751274 [Coprinellus micaceus]